MSDLSMNFSNRYKVKVPNDQKKDFATGLSIKAPDALYGKIYTVNEGKLSTIIGFQDISLKERIIIDELSENCNQKSK